MIAEKAARSIKEMEKGGTNSRYIMEIEPAIPAYMNGETNKGIRTMPRFMILVTADNGAIF